MENINEILKVINEIIDKEASTTAGMLCRRVEDLFEKRALTPDLYKSLSKDVIYEQSRVLKKFINMLFIPSIKFVSRDK